MMYRLEDDSLERKITKVEPEEDGSALVTYECGHSAIWVIPPRQDIVLACAECVDELLREHRGSR